MADNETREAIEARNPATTVIFGRYPTSDLITAAGLTEMKRRIADEAMAEADRCGKIVRALMIEQPERDTTQFDPLDQKWVVKWRATLE